MSRKCKSTLASSDWAKRDRDLGRRRLRPPLVAPPPLETTPTTFPSTTSKSRTAADRGERVQSASPSLTHSDLVVVSSPRLLSSPPTPRHRPPHIETSSRRDRHRSKIGARDAPRLPSPSPLVHHSSSPPRSERATSISLFSRFGLHLVAPSPSPCLWIAFVFAIVNIYRLVAFAPASELTH